MNDRRAAATELPRLTVRSFLRRLTSRAATGPAMWLVSYAVLVLDDLPFFWADRFTGWPALEEWLRSSLITTVTQAGIVVVLLIARATWLRAAFARRHAWLTVVTLMLANAVGTIVEATAGAVAASDIALISFDAVLYRLAALIVVAVAVSSIAEQRRLLGELQGRRRELEAARSDGESALTRVREEIVEVVSRQLGAAGADLAAAAETIRRISHELAFSEVAPPAARTIPPTRPSLRATWNAIAVRPLLAPGLMATVMTVLAVRATTVSASEVPSIPPAGGPDAVDTGIVLTVDLASAGRALLLIVAVWAGTYLATRLIARLVAEAGARARRPLPWWMHALAVVGAALLAQGLASLALLIPGSGGAPPFEPWMLGTYVLPILGCSIMVGLVRAVDRHAALTRDALEQVLARLQWDVSRLHALARTERRAMAFLLYGPALRAVRAAVQDLDGSGASDPSDAMIRAVVDAIRAGDPDRSRELQDRLDDLARLWECDRRIDLVVDEAVRLAVSGDSSSTSAIVDVVSEAVANSVTHARAERVAITLRMADVDLVEVVVEDESPSAGPAASGGGADGPPGLGSRLLDELTVLWHRYPSATGSRLQAWIPIGVVDDEEASAASEVPSAILDD